MFTSELRAYRVIGTKQRQEYPARSPNLATVYPRLRPGLSESEVLAVTWTFSGNDLYSMLVLDRGWTPSRYEEWLGSALIDLLLIAG